MSTIDLIQHAIPGTIFHSDQGSQYGAEQTREALVKKGFIRSMSRAGTPTDNGYAERFVGQFKLSVAERRKYQTLGAFLQAAEEWTNFYNQIRPHEGLSDLSPDQFAKQNGFPVSERIRLMTAPNRVAVVRKCGNGGDQCITLNGDVKARFAITLTSPFNVIRETRAI